MKTCISLAGLPKEYFKHSELSGNQFLDKVNTYKRKIILRDKLKKKRSVSDKEIAKKVAIGIFTEHNLYMKYCTQYSPGDPACVEGRKKLTNYVWTIVTGVSMYLHALVC